MAIFLKIAIKWPRIKIWPKNGLNIIFSLYQKESYQKNAKKIQVQNPWWLHMGPFVENWHQCRYRILDQIFVYSVGLWRCKIVNICGVEYMFLQKYQN